MKVPIKVADDKAKIVPQDYQKIIGIEKLELYLPWSPALPALDCTDRNTRAVEKSLIIWL